MKKLKPYLLTIGLVLGILIVVFIIKGIYPFGNNSLIWGDMHDQITAFYYHFYDCFKGSKSLLIDFSSSASVNFFGIIAYYILSPLSFITLLVKREDIYLVISVIVVLKILISALTCLYSIRYYFKKLPNLLSVLLAIIFAFSGYSLIMYQITPWIDVMYMFPLVMIGLKKTLDLEKPTVYIITLTLCLIFSFYVSMMMVIFIFLGSFIYLLVYKENKIDRKKGVLALGISTVISLLVSCFVVVPSYLQISISSRNIFNINTLLNSKLGPITDKLSLFLFGGVMYLGILLLLKNYKKHRRFLSFYSPIMLLLLIPILIEPINKVWHFGSYAFFPYRAGFITMFFLIIGACYSYQNYEPVKGIDIKNKNIISIILTIFISVSNFVIIYVNYSGFQKAVETLTISGNHLLLIVLIVSTIVSIIGCYIILLLNKKLNYFSLILIGIITLTHITVNTTLYLGMDYEQDTLIGQYEELSKISNDYVEGNYYRVKNEASNMIMNSGLVMKYHTLDHFTSLTDKNNLESLKKLGYSSMWVKTFSRGGTLFTDSILANKYIITRDKINSEYYTLTNSYDDLNFYTLNKTPSYGYYLLNNDTIFDKNNSFVISNSIYQNIVGNGDIIFDIIDDFDTENIEIEKTDKDIKYDILDEDAYDYLEKNIQVINKKTLYLEILKSLNNNDNVEMYEMFNIYINDRLYAPNAFSQNNNGVLNLGTYEDELVNIKIELVKDISLNNITIGVMDNKLYEEFMELPKVDTNISYDRNNIKLNIKSDKEQLLFLPIAYNEGYTATNNGKKIELVKVYDNFIGINLEEGVNDIKISFVPKGLIPCCIISIITLLTTVILIGTKLYNKLLNNEIILNIAYYGYLALYLGIILVIYVGLILCFILSYFMPIKI